MSRSLQCVAEGYVSTRWTSLLCCRKLRGVLFLLLLLAFGRVAEAQVATLSTTSLKFGNQAVGTTSAAKSVRLTNTGTVTLVVSSITAPTAPFADTSTGTSPCPAGLSFSLAPQSSCSVTVTFAPTTTGVFTSSILFADNAPSSPQIVNLSGTGVQQATLSTSNVTFGNVGVGVAATKSVTLNNNLNATLSFSASASGDFTVAGNNCSGTVAPLGHCSISITFTPSQLGTRSGTLTVTDSASNSPQLATLTGNGTVSSLSSITVTPANTTIAVGATQQYNATGAFPGSINLNLTTQVTWSSSSTTVATVSNTAGSQGLATGKAAGSATIRASINVNENTKWGSTSLTVTSGGLMTPIINWPVPAPIPYGTALSSIQLDATASAGGISVPGTFAYTPGAGTILAAGTQRLSVLFTPTDTTHYTTATASISLTVNKAAATVSLSNLIQTYTGSGLSPIVTTVPAGLSIVWTGAPDTNAGTYPVTATVNDPNYTGSASGSFVINAAPATVTLSNLTQNYTGGALTPTATTNPVGLPITWTGVPDTNTGIYPITATINSPNYTGSASGSFNISPVAATVTANATSKVYGSADPILTASETGFTAADAATIVIAATRAAGENVGTYTIIPSASGTAAANYHITYQNANFTITQAQPAFTSLTASQSITFGTASINLAGTIAAGSGYPPSGETVNISMNSMTVAATIGVSGAFIASFSTSTIPASIAPYVITYSYPGDTNFASVSNSTTTLSVGAPAATLVSIAVTPNNTSIAAAGTQQFTATGTYSDNSTQNVTGAVTWSSSATKVATINAAGLAIAAGTGTTIISATLGTITGSTFFSVNGTGAITPGGTMQFARDPFTATLLANGQVLMAGGYGVSGVLQTAELSDVTGSSFTSTGSMTTARAYHTATLLPNGKVLLVGGTNGSSALATAEIYDPSSGTFNATGSLQNARQSHTATLLQDGTVLIAGGTGASGDVAIAELFNPNSGLFTSVGNLMVPRDTHSATLLNDGTVLIAGGQNSSGVLASAELYVPGSQAFSTLPNYNGCSSNCALNTGRYLYTATLLNDGTVVFAGGMDNNGNTLQTAELYSPGSGTFTLLGNLSTARSSHTASLLTNGQVLLAGGTDPTGTPLASLELYDPNAQAFSLATDASGNPANLQTPRYAQTATKLTNGTLLLAGGVDNTSSPVASTELYSPLTLQPATVTAINVMPNNLTTMPVGTSQHFTATDQNGNPLASVTWIASGPATISNDTSNFGTAQFAAVGSGTISACAGSLCGSATFSVGPAALVSVVVTASGALNPTNPTIQVAAQQQFQATGTLTDNTTLDLTSLGTTTWASSTAAATISSIGLATGDTPGVSAISASSTYNASLGYSLGPLGNSIQLTVLTTSPVSPGTWTYTGSMNAARSAFAAVMLNSGKLLVMGGSANGPNLSSAELYDPGTSLFTTTGSMNLSRFAPLAALLNNGKVLVVGGDYIPNANACAATAELFDPQSGTFALTGSMTTPRCNFSTITVLQCPISNLSCTWGGKVLVTGGALGLIPIAPALNIGGGNLTNTAELYDPVAGTFTAIPNLMTDYRQLHTATLLNDGTVLIAGGEGLTNGLTSAEIYDPSVGPYGTFTAVSPMLSAHWSGTANLLDNGQVLIAGGGAMNYLLATVAELYSPTTKTFAVTGIGTPGGEIGASALLNNGDALITGSLSSSGIAPAALYDPLNLFSPTGNLNIPRWYQTETLLADGSGRVLVAGGIDSSSNPQSSAELYYPVSLVPAGVTGITVLPPSSIILAAGSSMHLVAQDQNGNQLSSVTWNSSNSTSAQVSNDQTNQGTVYAVGTGSATITACVGTTCGSAIVNVP
jgi:hypothetical protein